MADFNGRPNLQSGSHTESIIAIDSEDNDCDTLTMVDFLKEEKQLEDDVKAVLGSSNDDTCTYAKEKSHENLLNCYNYNFDGNYCTCLRPYPDDSVPDDEMIQCIICEDWYHTKHLGSQEPPANFAEMICFRCVAKNKFLNYYRLNESTEQHLDAQENGIRCHLKEPPAPTDDQNKCQSLFMASDWRQSLCRCVDCNALYVSSKVSYLLDPEDSVQAYEDKNLAMASSDEIPSQYEQGLKALSALDHVDQIEVIEGYNDMKDQLLDYLQKFADKKQVVKAEDIHEFFSGMQARKKPKFELPHFCR